jgi:DNA-binding PadR family transcriptional regulator
MPNGDQPHASSPGEKTLTAKQEPYQARPMSPLIYELFVLGELMVQPLYGSLLHEIAQRILGPWRPLSWGILSPLMRRLEQEGLITSVVEQRQESVARSGRGQPPRIYSITPMGQERFLTLMLIPSPYSRETREVFVIKLSKSPFLTPAQQLSVLAWYRGYLTDICSHHQSERSELLHAAYIGEKERPGILQAIDYQLHTVNADLSWLDSLMARLQETEREQTQG